MIGVDLEMQYYKQTPMMLFDNNDMNQVIQHMKRNLNSLRDLDYLHRRPRTVRPLEYMLSNDYNTTISVEARFVSDSIARIKSSLRAVKSVAIEISLSEVEIKRILRWHNCYLNKVFDSGPPGMRVFYIDRGQPKDDGLKISIAIIIDERQSTSALNRFTVISKYMTFGKDKEAEGEPPILTWSRAYSGYLPFVLLRHVTLGAIK